MNFTQEELKELQAINSVKEEELGTRAITPQEIQIFNATVEELWEKGFVVSKANFLKLWLAFDANPNVPINRGNILETTKVFRDEYDWKSAEEMEFRKLSDQLGPATTELVIKQLGRHGLVNTPGIEDTFNNFNQVIRYYQSQGWQISADSFEKAIGNLRHSMNHGALVYRQTPSQLAAAKRWENTRAATPTKSALEIAKQKAREMSHVVNPDGRRMSDVIMEEFYKAHPEEVETPVAQTPPPMDPDEAFYERQTRDYIRSIASNNIRVEAQKEYGHQHNGSWGVTYHLLRNWHERRAPGAPQR